MAAARKETLELEIKALIAEARKNVQSMREEISQLAKEAQKAAPQTKAIAEALNRVNGQEMKRAAAEAKLFGDSLGTVKKQQSLVRDAMIDLVEGGLEPASEEVQKLLQNYEDLERQSKDIAKASGETIDSFDKLKSAIRGSAAAIALVKVAASSLDYGAFALDAEDKFRAGREEFGIMLQDMKAGAGLFSVIQEFNAWTPFDLETTKQGAKLLMGAKVPLSELIEKITQFGDLSQGNSERLISFMRAFSKASAKGAADMEVLNVYVDQGIQIFDALAAQVGAASDEIPKMASEGKISFGDLTAAIEAMTSEGGQYFGGMELASKRLSAMQDGLDESVTALAASYGKMLYPAMISIVGLLTSMTDAVNENPLLQGLLAGALIAVAGYLAVLTIRIIAMTVKTWLQYAAQMGLNSALAVTNPLLIAGILAVGAATAAAVAYAASQSKAAESTEETALAAKTASQAVDQYRNALKGMGVEELKAAQATLQAQLARANGRLGTEQADANLKLIIAELKRRNDEAIAALNDTAKKWKEEWAKDYEKDVAARSSDKYAELSLDLKRKFLDAAAAGVGAGGEEGIDKVVSYLAAHEDDLAIDALKNISGANIEAYNQILEYYRKKRNDIDTQIAQSERETMTKLTETKIDDLMIARDKEIAAAKNNATIIDAIQKKYSEEIRVSRAEEARKAAEKVFDLANKSRAIDASLSASRVDDIELERDRALKLFSGTEQQKLLLAKNFARQIADAQIEEDRRVFQERLAAARKSGDYGEYAGLAAQDAAKDTDIGKALGFGGMPSADPVTQFLDAVIDAAMELENVNKLMNYMDTIVGAIFDVIGPFLDGAAGEFVDILVEFGTIIGQLLLPYMDLLGIAARGLAGLLRLAMGPLKLFADGLTWLYNTVIRAFANGLIAIMNGVITALNKLPAVNIKKLEYLSKIGDLAADIAEEMERKKDLIAGLYERQADRVKDELAAQIDSLKSQYELGLINREDYQRQVETYAATADAKLYDINKEMKALLAKIENNTYSALSADQKATAAAAEASWNENKYALDKTEGWASNAYDKVTDATGSELLGYGAAGVAGAAGLAVDIAEASAGAIVDTVGAIVDVGKKAVNWVKKWSPFDVGSISIPSDMPAYLHQGEMVISKPFAQGVRSGDISISGRGSGSRSGGGTVVNYYVDVHVGGSVIKKDDLIEEIYDGLSDGISSGKLSPLPA